MRTPKVAVVGGSIIGLSCAFRARAAGYDVTVFEPDTSAAEGLPGRGAAWVAGGMLAPIGEAWPGEDTALHLGIEALAAWPALLSELVEFEEASTHAKPNAPSQDDATSAWTRGPVRTATDSVLVAVDEADARDLGMALEWAQRELAAGEAHPVHKITRREMRQLEPGLSGTVRAAYHLPGEGAVDNRHLLGALSRGCRARGVRFVARRIEELSALAEYDVVILAAGAGAAQLAGLPIRNVKGEVLRLFERPGCEPAPRHVVRAHVRGRPLYMVPRDGGMVVGATQYEHGEDRQVTAAGVRDLLADAETIFPAIGEYELREAIAGLRPMSHDNLPYIGPIEISPAATARPGQRILAACGHGRNGVALASVTAKAVVAYLEDGADATVSAAVAACAPHRVPGRKD